MCFRATARKARYEHRQVLLVTHDAERSTMQKQSSGAQFDGDVRSTTAFVSWQITLVAPLSCRQCRHLYFTPVVLNLFWPMDHLFFKIISDEPLCYADSSWTAGRNFFSHTSVNSRVCSMAIYGTLCGPLEIPGGQPVVHLDHVEKHCLHLV